MRCSDEKKHERNSYSPGPIEMYKKNRRTFEIINTKSIIALRKIICMVQKLEANSYFGDNGIL